MRSRCVSRGSGIVWSDVQFLIQLILHWNWARNLAPNYPGAGLRAKFGVVVVDVVNGSGAR